MICDSGTQFVFKIVKYLAKECSVQLQTTAPYSPHSNPVERSNRVVKTMIAQYVRNNQKAWNLHLEELQIAVNTAEHYSTGYTPAMLCFGRELQALRAMCGPNFETHGHLNEPTVVELKEQCIVALKRMYEQTHRNLNASYLRKSRYYNLQRREVRYEVGDLFLRKLHVLSSAEDGVVGKLAPSSKALVTS